MFVNVAAEAFDPSASLTNILVGWRAKPWCFAKTVSTKQWDAPLSINIEAGAPLARPWKVMTQEFSPKESNFAEVS
jgi:hypothetical protein